MRKILWNNMKELKDDSICNYLLFKYSPNKIIELWKLKNL